jgi:CheY-like chemotaxis protein
MQVTSLKPSLLNAFSRVYFSIKEKRKTMKASLLILSALMCKKTINIFLADDDPDDREIFLEVIGEVVPHVNTTIARNGKELMALLNEHQVTPDIIFLDLNMPLMNGQECLVEIRNNEKLKEIPVIIYSTSWSHEHIEDTFKKGANFYFPKPDSLKDLKTMVTKIFSLDWDEFMKPQKDKFILSINHFRL